MPVETDLGPGLVQFEACQVIRAHALCRAETRDIEHAAQLHFVEPSGARSSHAPLSGIAFEHDRMLSSALDLDAGYVFGPLGDQRKLRLRVGTIARRSEVQV